MKRIAVLAAFAAVVGLLAGCSDSEHTPDMEKFKADLVLAGYPTNNPAEWENAADNARRLCNLKPRAFRGVLEDTAKDWDLPFAQVLVKHFCPGRAEEFNKVARLWEPNLVLKSGAEFAK